MAKILGLNAGHPDSSAVLVIDGVIVAACAEERLGQRIKHSNQFPVNAVREVLSSGKCLISDIDAIAIASDPSKNLTAKLKFGLRNPRNILGAAFTSIRNQIKKSSHSISERLNKELAMDSEEHFRAKVFHVEHHLSHISSAYYTSGFEGEVLGMSYDGSGDFASLMLAKCKSGKIDIIDRVLLPDSLGIFYTALCQFIGFDKFGEEYKVMGLAPYGEDKFSNELDQLISVETAPDGWFSLNQDFFNMHSGRSADSISNPQIEMGQMYSDKLENLLGPARRDRTSPIEQRHKDIAKSTQVKFEDVAIALIKKGYNRVNSKKLVLSGGCALNGVCNSRILRDTKIRQLYVHPASSDDGTAAGAALFVAATEFGDYSRELLVSPFLGPVRTEKFNIERSKIVNQFHVSTVNTPNEAASVAAKLVADGMVVGWYQGRSEWGPRALGNRSILGNPLDPTMKEKINAKIKKRESFRPFAPSVLESDAIEYFVQNVSSPYMTFVVDVRPEWRDRLPAVTHVDGSARIQTVSSVNNPLYFFLLQEVKKLTGVGMVLNTSFNENEPVVETPEQAYLCFERTDMDALFIDTTIFLKKKPSNFEHTHRFG